MDRDVLEVIDECRNRIYRSVYFCCCGDFIDA